MHNFFLLLLLLFTACQDKSVPFVVQEPTWIISPSTDGKIGAVGSAKAHFKGKNEQRRLAISRALDELAQQSGVHVGTSIMRNEKRTGAQTSSSAEIYSIQNSANETIKAHIQAVWTNPKTEEMYIWLLAD